MGHACDLYWLRKWPWWANSMRLNFSHKLAIQHATILYSNLCMTNLPDVQAVFVILCMFFIPKLEDTQIIKEWTSNELVILLLLHEHSYMYKLLHMLLALVWRVCNQGSDVLHPVCVLIHLLVYECALLVVLIISCFWASYLSSKIANFFHI